MEYGETRQETRKSPRELRELIKTMSRKEPQTQQEKSKMTAIRDIQTPKNVTEIVAAKPLQDLTCEKNRWQRAKVI